MKDAKTSNRVGFAPATGPAPVERPYGWVADSRVPAGRDPIDDRIAEMRAFLAKMRPQSDAEALKCLRSAFPDASLAARVAVIAQTGSIG